MRLIYLLIKLHTHMKDFMHKKQTYINAVLE